MKRHREETAGRQPRKAKKEAEQILDGEALALATGEQAPIATGAEDTNPGEKKKLWAVFPVKVPPKKAAPSKPVAQNGTRAQGAAKKSTPPSAPRGGRGSERSLA